MSARFQFLPEEDEKLVEIVARHPALYDASRMEYKDQMMKENIWKEISNEVERSVADCKKRWRNIRDTYMKQRKPGSTGSAAKGKSKWSLLGQLEFLNKVAYERNTQSNITIEELNETSHNEVNEKPVEQEENTFSETVISTANNSVNTAVNLISENGQKRTVSTPTSSVKKRKDNSGKIIEILQKRSIERENMLKNICGKNIEEDAIFTFFKSLAMTVKTFPPELIVQAKSRIHNIMTELELQSIQQSQNQFSQQHFTTNLHDSRPGTSHSEAPSDDIGSYYTNFSPGDISFCSDHDLTQL